MLVFVLVLVLLLMLKRAIWIYFTQYLIELAFNDSYLFAMMHLIPADYTETLDCLSRSIAKHDVILPLAALFLLFSQVGIKVVDLLTPYVQGGKLTCLEVQDLVKQ